MKPQHKTTKSRTSTAARQRQTGAHPSAATRRRRQARKSTWRCWLRRTLIALAAIVGFTVLAYLIVPNFMYRVYTKIAGTYKPADDEGYDGIDVSHHNGRIDWQQVAGDKNIQFVYVKATEGYLHPDSRFRSNVRGAHKAGIKVGSYHVLTTKKAVSTQFHYFMQTIKGEEQDLRPMVDIEENKVRAWDNRQLRDSLAKFVKLTEQHCHTTPVIYCGYKLYAQRLEPHFNNCVLFIARYGKEPPTLESSGRQHNIWQFTERGSVAGISGDVDLNRFGSNTSLSDISY